MLRGVIQLLVHTLNDNTGVQKVSATVQNATDTHEENILQANNEAVSATKRTVTDSPKVTLTYPDGKIGVFLEWLNLDSAVDEENKPIVNSILDETLSVRRVGDYVKSANVKVGKTIIGNVIKDLRSNDSEYKNLIRPRTDNNVTVKSAILNPGGWQVK